MGSCRKCAARSWWCTAPTTSRFRSRMRRRWTMPGDRRTRYYACSRARKAARNTASAIISRSAAPPCGVGSRTSSFTPSVRPAGLNSRNDDDLALRLEADVQPARASEEAGVERLNRVGVDRAVFRSALQQGGHALRNAGIEPRAGDTEAHALSFSDGVDGQRAAARDRLARADQQVEQQLDPGFRQQRARQVPGELRVAVLGKRARHPFAAAATQSVAGA